MMSASPLVVHNQELAATQIERMAAVDALRCWGYSPRALLSEGSSLNFEKGWIMVLIIAGSFPVSPLDFAS